MASDPKSCPKWPRVSLCFLLFYLSWANSSVSSEIEVKDRGYFPNQDTRLLRTIRQRACQDGTYQHEGKSCCLCAAGQRLEKHCSMRPNDRVCVFCEPGKTYSSNPNSQPSCEPCTSCSQPDENLEEEEACTTARNRVCRCKQHHYCGSGTETCRFCNPCKECGIEGIKLACTANNNTVCNDTNEGGNNLMVVLIVGVIILALILLVFVCWKKKCFAKATQLLHGETTGVTHRPAVEMEPLEGVDLSSHIPDIAAVLGWTVVRDVALSSGMSDTAIETQKLNHPSDVEEQTLQLLSAWVEREGREASTKLIQILHHKHKRGKAEKVMAIMKGKECPGGNAGRSYAPAGFT